MVSLAAAIPKYAPNVTDPNVLSTWYDELGLLDLDALRGIYKQAIKMFDTFPSIRQLLALAGGAEQSDDEKGREVGERIYAAIARYGSVIGDTEHSKQRRAAVAEMIGPIGEEVVRLQGGWNHLCDAVMDDDATTWKAQWRELATTIARRGQGMAAPQFSQIAGKTHAAIAELATKLSIVPVPNKAGA